MRFSTSITLGGKTCITSVPRGSIAWRKATQVFCPLGPAPTRAWVLMRRADVADLTAHDAQSLVWSHVGIDGAASRELTFSGLYLVNAERLLHGGPSDDNALYLVELADARWKIDQTRETGAIRANIRSFANNSDYLTGTSGYTWTSLVTALWNACGLLGAFPGLPVTLTAIDGVPQNSYFIGLNAWRSLCAVLEQLDCAVDHDPLSNTYTIVQLGADQTVPDNSDTLRWNSQPLNLNANRSAGTLRIYFNYHRKSYGQERDTELANNWAYNGAGDIKDIATGIAGASGTKALWDDLPWILGENNTHTNLADIETRRDNRKARYVTRWSVVPQHRVHSGLLDNLVTGGQVRAVLWRNWDDSENDFGGTVTEFVAKPELVTGLRATDAGPAWIDAELAAHERENYAPPDLGRHSFPNYPRLPNIVQVINTGADPGATVSPNADGFHEGKVARWVANAMVTLDDCFIRFVDDHDNADGQVDAINEDYYGPARLSGISTSDGDTRPVYLVRKGGEGASSCKRFKLTAELNTGSNAAAVLRTFDGAAYVDGDAIKVFDWWGTSGSGRGMWQGTTGMEGWCVKREVNADQTEGAPDEYDIVWMETYAWDIEFELTADMGAVSAPAMVVASMEQGVDPGASIIVHDDQGLFPEAREGARGFAIRSEYADPENPGTPYYKVVQCQQVALTGRAVLSEQMCQAGQYSISGFSVASPSPFNQNINPSGAFNDFSLMGEAGDTVWLEYDTTTGAYIITQVTHKVDELVFDIRIQGDYIQALTTNCAVMYCTPPQWVDKIPIRRC